MRYLAPSALLFLLLFVPNGPTPVQAEEPKPAKPVTKGARELGFAISEAADGDFGRAYATARDAGMEVTSLSVAWDEIEKKPGVFQSHWLPIANAFYGPRKVKLALVLKTLDTTQVRFPKDLKGKPFDAPDVLARFRAFLTYVLKTVKDVELSSLSPARLLHVCGASPRCSPAWAALQPLNGVATTASESAPCPD